MQRLNLETWRNIFTNIEEEDQDVCEAYGDEVEVIWLDPGDASPGEWVLAYGYTLFEDGFTTEEQAHERLNYLEGVLI